MQAPSTQTLQVAGVVLFYMTAALVMVFVNKAVLNGSPEIPVLFLLIQVVIAVILLHVTAFFSRQVELPKVDKATAKKLIPVIFVNGIGLIFNTLCLREVEATFYQIARGMVLPMTIIASTIDTHNVPSWRVIIAASIVTLGFLVGVAPDPSVPVRSAPSLISLLYGLLSAFFIAIHAVLVKRSLSYCNNSTIQLAWWTNAGTALLFLPFVILQGEPSTFLQMMRNTEWNGITFMWGCLVTGFFGFLLSIAGLLSVKVTSPITHMFSSAVRSVIQTILGVLIFNDLINVSRAGSILVILLGTLFYTWVKHSEGAQKQGPAKQDDVEAIKLMPKNEEDETVIWQHQEEQDEKERT